MDHASFNFPRKYHLHVDGGLYRLAGCALNSDTLGPMAIYEHLHPFEQSFWSRPLSEFEHRFEPIGSEQAQAILALPREALSQKIAQSKADRRTRETLAAPPPPRLHCLGFMFDPSASRVALIRKKNPQWQRGKLNGIGGKTEAGETSLDSLVREFSEEAGVETSAAQWKLFARIGAPEFEVHAYCCFDARIANCISATDETVEIIDVNDPAISEQGLSGLKGLILGALDPDAPFMELHYRDWASAAQSRLLSRRA